MLVRRRSAGRLARDGRHGGTAGARDGPPAACGDGPALLANISTRDKLAQLLMVGVNDAADARAVVDTHHVGGIMVGSWTDLSMVSDGSLADIANAAAPLPLAVSVDEEGGRVSRLSTVIGIQPSARVLAQTKTPEQVYEIARQRGQAMRSRGFTMDFAPVVDVTDAPDDTVIGDRSFGSDPAVVTDYAGAYARGLREAGLLPVLKHFPGHGHGSGDSHTGAVTTPPVADLQNSDLVPYRTLAAQPPVGVMVGHMQVPGLTGSDPASLSPNAYALLRSGSLRRPAVQRPRVHRRPVVDAGHLGSLRRRRCGPAGTAGRCRHRVVGDHRRGARRTGPAGEGGGGGRVGDASGGRVSAADGRRQGAQSPVRWLSRSHATDAYRPLIAYS